MITYCQNVETNLKRKQTTLTTKKPWQYDLGKWEATIRDHKLAFFFLYIQKTTTKKILILIKGYQF